MIAPLFRVSSVCKRQWLSAVVALGVASAAAVAATPPAAAQSSDIQPLINTVDRLERQLQALERAVYRGSPPPAGAGAAATVGGDPALAQIQFKVSQLEEQLRGLTGQIEELGNEVRKTNNRLDRLVADVDFRLRTLEGGGAGPVAAPGAPMPTAGTTPEAAAPAAADAAAPVGSPGVPGTPRTLGTLTESQLREAGVAAPGGEGALASPPQTAAVPPADSSVLPPGSPEQRYDYARAFLMRRDFAGAEQALRAFVDTYPENPLAGNAQYWLGETYYVRKDYGAAARTFADGFQRFPGSDKAPDNLLKLGMSLAALERIEDACITFDKLSSEYPQAAANIKRLAEQERARLKCQ